MAKDIIAELEATLSTNLAEFKAEMDKAADAVKGSSADINKNLATTKSSFIDINSGIFFFVSNLKMIGGAVIDTGKSIYSLVEKQLDMAGSLVDTADKLHISTTALQIYRKVAEDTGVTNDVLEVSINKFVKSMGELQQGQGGLAGYLDKTNISLKEQLEGAKNTDEAYQIMMTALAKMEPGFEQNTLAMQAFGKAGAGMVVMVKDGAEAFDAQIERIKAMGIVIDEDLLRNAEAAGDSIADLSLVISSQFSTAVISLAPAISTITGEMTKWISGNKELISVKTDEYVQKISTALTNFDFEGFASKIDKMVTVIGLVPKAFEGWGMIIDIVNGNYDKLVVSVNAGSDKMKEKIGLLKVEIKELEDYLEDNAAVEHVFKIKLDDSDKEQKLAKLKQELAELEGKETTTKIIANVEEFGPRIEKAKLMLEDIITPKSINLTLNDEQALYQLNNVTGMLEKVKSPPPILVTANTDPAVADVLLMKEKIEKGGVVLPVDANIEPAKRGFERLEFFVGEKNNQKAFYIDVKVNTKEAEETTTELEQKIKNMQASVRIGGNTDDALKELQKIKNLVEREKAMVALGADPTMAKDDVRDLEKLISETEAAIKILAEKEPAEAILKNLKAEIDNTTATIKIDANTDEAKKKIDELAEYNAQHSRKLPTLDTLKAQIEEINKKKEEGIQLSARENAALKLLLSTYQAIAHEQYKPGEKTTSGTDTIPKYGAGTGLSGLKKDGLIYAHKNEIILTPQESDVFRGIANGAEPSQFLQGLRPLVISQPGSSTVSSTTNQNSRNVENHYHITIQQQVLGDRPAMSAREMAAEITQKLDQQKIRFGELQ